MAVWLDGDLLADEAATVAVQDRGFTLGDGVFETMRWSGQGVVFFDAHMARLSHAARTLLLADDIDEGRLMGAIGAVCGADGAAKAVRVTLTRGSGPRGLAVPQPVHPRWLVSAAPWAPAGAIESLQPSSIARAAAGAIESLQPSSIARAAGAPSARFKTLSYIDNVMALAEARARGGDEAILRGRHGEPVCASAGNLVAVVDGAALTPPVEAGALPGITRGALLAAGALREQALDWSDLDRAEALAVTNALVGVRPVRRYGGRRLIEDHPVLRQLQHSLAVAQAASLTGWRAGQGPA